MLKKSLIAVATAVVLAGSAFATATGATAASASATEISAKGGWNGHGQWKGHGGGKHGGHKKWKPRRACQPIIRWKKVGYRYHRRWQPIVVGWDCHRKHKRYKSWKWH